MHLELISSRKVSVCETLCVTEFNVCAWLSIAVPTTSHKASWMMMSFSKAKTFARICSMEVSVIFSNSASSRASVIDSGCEGRSAVDFGDPGSEGRSAVHFRSAGSISRKRLVL